MQFILATFDTTSDASGNISPHPDTWIVRAGIAHDPAFIQWSWSFYHAMTQLLAISVGVVDPRRISEIWCYLASITLGATLYAFFVASLTSVFSEVGSSARLYRAKCDQLEHYMRHHHLPKDMRAKLRAYYQLCFPGRTMFDAEEIVAGLSHPLRGQIALIQCRGVLESLQLLDDERLSRAVAAMLERIVFVDGDYVIYEGEEGRGLYFIFDGLAEGERATSERVRTNYECTMRGARTHAIRGADARDAPAVPLCIRCGISPLALLPSLPNTDTQPPASSATFRLSPRAPLSRARYSTRPLRARSPLRAAPHSPGAHVAGPGRTSRVQKGHRRREQSAPRPHRRPRRASQARPPGGGTHTPRPQVVFRGDGLTQPGRACGYHERARGRLLRHVPPDAQPVRAAAHRLPQLPILH